LFVFSGKVLVKGKKRNEIKRTNWNHGVGRRDYKDKNVEIIT